MNINTYVNEATKNDIDYLIPSYITDNNLKKIELKGLPENAQTYTNPSNFTEIIIYNEKKDKAIIITISHDNDFAVKIANSVVFPN